MTRNPLTLAARKTNITLIICCTLLGFAQPGMVSGQGLPPSTKLLATSEEALLTALDAQHMDEFGSSVAISGDIAIVGAEDEDNGGFGNSGAAYIFRRNQGGAGTWEQVVKLTPSDPAILDRFGTSVSIDGDTAVVGALYHASGGINDSGAAYVFRRNQGGADAWGQVTKLSASDAAENMQFGYSVSISFDSVIVGAPGTTAAYIFMRNHSAGDAWGEVAKLTPAGPDPGGGFGLSVALSGDTAVVGCETNAPGGLLNAGAAYIFNRNLGGGDNWGQVKKLTASDVEVEDRFGNSVAISGDTIVVGAYGDRLAEMNWVGSAYVFARNHGGSDSWGELTKLTASDPKEYDRFGFSVAIIGETIVAGSLFGLGPEGSSPGAAYVFERNQGGADDWGQVSKVVPSSYRDADRFGFSVALNADHLVVGATRAAPSGTSVTGAAFVFHRSGDTWTEVAKPVAPDASSFDRFGVVAMDGEVLVVGSPEDDHSAVGNAGSAYVFERNQGGADDWGLVTKIFAADPTDGAKFGTSLAIAGDTIVVGCPEDNPGGISSAGSAYVFQRNQGGMDTWGQVSKMTAADGAAGDLFGSVVGISGDTVVVGTPEDNHVEAEAGSAYIFARNQGGADAWGQVAKLTAADAASDDNFGCSVSISGDAVVVGASHDDHSGQDQAGSAYIFARNQGGADNWGQSKKIASGDPGPYEWFGSDVSIANDTVVVVAVLQTSVYIFRRNRWGADAWGEVDEIEAADVGAFHFGSSVRIFGDRMIVGCHVEEDLSGSAYLFERNQDGADAWGFVEKLTANDGASQNYFGRSVAITHHAVAVGAPQDDDGGPDSGSAHVFQLSTDNTEEIFSDDFESGDTREWSSVTGG